MRVLDCIVQEHNIWLVLVAGFICIAGSWVTARLFHRTTVTSGRRRLGWHFLAALSAGAAIWCTHFVAMLGFDTGAPVGFDPVLTIVSLLIAVVGTTIGFVLAGSQLTRMTPAFGGAFVGLSIAAMHYTGMMAYRVQGLVSWDMSYLLASILLSIGFAAAALHFGVRNETRARNLMAGLFALAILTLHFTGMTALRVQSMLIGGSFSNPQALQALALAVAGMALLILATGLVSFLIDDSTQAETVKRLRRLALSDALTGLPNRASYNERLDLETEVADARKSKFALIGIDLNRFKEINDIRGHAAGDEVLRHLGRRLKALLREGDGEYIARTGGDEFTALYRMGDTADTDAVLEFVSRMEAAFSKPVHFGGFEIKLGASFGIALWPDDAADKELLVNKADFAMYRAKTSPLRKICFYEAGMDDQIKARRSLAIDLREAMTRNELSLHYQVQMSVTTGEIAGYEALLRWQHPELGSISPTTFVPIAEESGLIDQIGEWVLRTACREAATWEPPYKVAVNLSPIQFLHTDLYRLVMDILIETGLPPARLELELTEAAIFADRARALHLLRQIKGLGVSIALDDFGIGYSSLDTLRSFSFDRIKIDRSFFSATESNPQTLAIIRAVLALGKSFGIPVLAEGIETYDQLAMLNVEGCEEAQGFLLGHPTVLEEIVAHGQIRHSVEIKSEITEIDPASSIPAANAEPSFDRVDKRPSFRRGNG